MADMTPTPDTQPREEAVRRIADLLDENAECYSENAMDRAFLGNSEKLAALVVEYLALSASPASGGVDAVAVKPLEWLSDREPFFAASPFCMYRIVSVDDDTGPHWETTITYKGSTYKRAETLDEAKAAAQADYEARIRSALSPAPTSGSEAGGECPSCGAPRKEACRRFVNAAGCYLYKPTVGSMPFLADRERLREKIASEPDMHDTAEDILTDGLDQIILTASSDEADRLSRCLETARATLGFAASARKRATPAPSPAGGVREAIEAIGKWHMDQEPNTGAMSESLARDLMERWHQQGRAVQQCQHILRALSPATAARGGCVVKPLEWGEPAKPNGKDRFYDHVEAHTPFGLFLLEWKSWKDRDPISIELNGGFVGVGRDLDDAKQKAFDWLEARIRSALASPDAKDTP